MYDILLCDHCIEAIRSRGEKLFVGGEFTDHEIDEEAKCEWCEEEDTVYEVIFQ